MISAFASSLQVRVPSFEARYWAIVDLYHWPYLTIYTDIWYICIIRLYSNKNNNNSNNNIRIYNIYIYTYTCLMKFCCTWHRLLWAPAGLCLACPTAAVPFLRIPFVHSMSNNRGSWSSKRGSLSLDDWQHISRYLALEEDEDGWSQPKKRFVLPGGIVLCGIGAAWLRFARTESRPKLDTFCLDWSLECGSRKRFLCVQHCRTGLKQMLARNFWSWAQSLMVCMRWKKIW